MAREAANDGAFDASLRLGGGARKGEAQNGGTEFIGEIDGQIRFGIFAFSHLE
jgi:hypothetical protein